MKFKLEIKCDNAAFGDNALDRGYEVARILKKLSLKVEDEAADVGEVLPLFDTNGNCVGEAKVTK